MANLETAFRNGVRDIALSQAEGASSIVLSVDRASRDIGSLAGALANVDTTIGSLCSTIDSGFSELSYQMRMQSAQLRAILKVLQAPLDTQSKELRSRAQEAYSNGWIDDAESDFIQSVELNRYDFTLHQGLGNIAFLHRGNLVLAREHFERSARYAGPKSPPDAAVAYISLTAVAEAAGDLQEALGHAHKALNACADLGESHYVVAKYTSATGGDSRAVVETLVEAFRRCIALTLWADNDSLLKERRDVLDEALHRFRDELRSEVQGYLGDLRNWRQSVALVLQDNIRGTGALSRIESEARVLEGKCERLVNLDSILDLHEARTILVRRLPTFLQDASEAARLAANKLQADIHAGTRSLVQQAEREKDGVRSMRSGFAFVGGVVGSMLGGIIAMEWVFLGLIVGAATGLFLNAQMVDRRTGPIKDYTGDANNANTLINLSEKLQNARQSLPQVQRSTQSSALYVPTSNSSAEFIPGRPRMPQ